MSSCQNVASINERSSTELTRFSVLEKKKENYYFIILFFELCIDRSGYMRSLHLWFLVFAIENCPFTRNISSNSGLGNYIHPRAKLWIHSCVADHIYANFSKNGPRGPDVVRGLYVAPFCFNSVQLWSFYEQINSIKASLIFWSLSLPYNEVCLYK